MDTTQASLSALRMTALLVGMAVGCGGEGPSEIPATPSVYVAGVVRDPDGTPVPRITVTWELWPAPDSVQQGAVSDFSTRWFMRTDDAGGFVAHAGYYGIESLDSVELAVTVGECWGLASVAIRERAVTLNPGVPDTMSRELVLGHTAPPARLAVGPACAVIVGPPPDQLEDVLALWIDEISDSVRGRWLKNYQASFGSEYGLFSGAREGSLVTLDLRPESPKGICNGYTLELPLEAGDTFGIATHRSDSCPLLPPALRFVEAEPFPWPFP